MKILLKHAVLVTFCLVGFLASVVYTQERNKNPATYRDGTAFPYLNREDTETDGANIDREVEHINHLNLTSISLGIEVCEHWEKDSEGSFCDVDQEGYEYNVTFHADSAQHIRKVAYSKFSLQGNYVVDLEEYYDLRGNLIYLEYSGLGNKENAFEYAEIHGRIYFRETEPIKNLSYAIDREKNGVILTSNQLQPDEFHINLQNLQRMLESHITPFMQHLINAVNEPCEDITPILPAIRQRCLETAEFYEKLQAVFASNI
jgi:hypothetical protein